MVKFHNVIPVLMFFFWLFCTPLVFRLMGLDPRGAVYQWDGASIPVVSTLKACSGAAPLLVGFGQPEDRIHSPNESYGLNQFARAMAWAEKILAALAD